MNAISFGLLGMFAFGLANIFAIAPIKKLGSRRAFFFRGFFVSIILFPVVALTGISFSLLPVLMTLGLSVFAYLALSNFYRGLELGKPGLVVPVANSSMVVTIVLSEIFYRQGLLMRQAAGIILIITGVIVISINFRDLKNSHLFSKKSGVPYALVATFSWGILFFLMKIPVASLGPFFTTWLVESGAMLMVGIQLLVTKNKFEVKKSARNLFFTGLCVATAGVAFNYGVQNANVSIVTALVFSNPLVTVLLSRIFLKEKMDQQQWIAITLIILGIVMQSY